MTSSLSANTKAILLLTAPLIAGKSAASSELLSPGEYKALARHLREMQRQPADLVASDASELLRSCRPVVDESRLQRLLGRGFLLSQVIERWQARAIWVYSRADAEYPRRFKSRLREDAPAVIYGCGDVGLLDSGGLAVVGSRHVDDSLVDYTVEIGRLTARARASLVSGGAKGIDQAAMRGALEVGGKVIGVLADSLEKTAMNREHRNMLLEGQLVLVSPYDPSAGFNVGHAMQRNKLIYALADASLVVSSDVDKGGTWAGATEQLDKLHFVPVYVRSTGERSAGLEALMRKGAIPWPNPQDADAFTEVLEVNEASKATAPDTAPLFEHTPEERVTPKIEEPSVVSQPQVGNAAQSASESPTSKSESLPADDSKAAPEPADIVFGAVREAIQLFLRAPMKDAEIATALGVSNAQAKAWLQRLVDEGFLEKQKRPAGYVIKRIQAPLFDK